MNGERKLKFAKQEETSSADSNSKSSPPAPPPPPPAAPAPRLTQGFGVGIQPLLQERRHGGLLGLGDHAEGHVEAVLEVRLGHVAGELGEGLEERPQLLRLFPDAPPGLVLQHMTCRKEA